MNPQHEANLTVADLSERMAPLMVRDAHNFRRRLDRLRTLERRATTEAEQGKFRAELAKLDQETNDAETRVERRRRALPTPTYPPGLPITDRKDELLEVIRDNQVVIVAGETGSGKSTQLPKICLELGRGVQGFIGHTQPRRLAARTVSERIADELDTSIGEVVGYTVRFTDKVREASYVKLMTDGILLAELQRDRLLTNYDTLIIDEAHERSLNIDFILGYLKQLLPRRPDLKVIVTSATIDTDRFSTHFSDAPVVEVSGRTFPVETRYRPLSIADEDSIIDRGQVDAIGDAVKELSKEGPGDILVFLPGERDIRDAADGLEKLRLPDTEILPLYARLSSAEQHRVFAKHSGRRVVLATNVAETSLTVPGVRYVVDTGTARISRYNRRTKVQRLPIEAISQASANQRAGRCGRVAPGICIRLYEEEDFLQRPEFTEPEILRTNLAAVILQMASIGLGDIAAFPFVEPPDERSINDGIALLEELDALDPEHPNSKKWLTSTGRRLAKLPIDPRLGRMVLEAAENDCVREVAVIAAVLSIQDPRERPTGKEQLAAEYHNRFRDPDSDFIAILNLWDYLTEQRRDLSSNQFRRLCRSEYLNFLRVREWMDLASQLRSSAKNVDIRVNNQPAEPEWIHRSLLAGLLSHVGMRDPEKQDYLGARNSRFIIGRGSTMGKKQPRWVMAAELVETNRIWARMAARIEPDWAEDVGSHVAKYSYGDPEWNPERGTAQVSERVTLYGLPIVTGRIINVDRVNKKVARELFIRHALVDGDWDIDHAFVAHNRELVERVRSLEDRIRTRNLLVDETTIFDFYDQRLEDDVTSTRHFDSWWKRTKHDSPDLLDFSLDLLVNPNAPGGRVEDYPDTWTQGDHELRLSYIFRPEAETDGVIVRIPLTLLNQINPAGFDWQVPGFREDLVTGLIRGLPKNYRRNLVPVPEHVRAVLDSATPADGSLIEAMTRELTRYAGVAIPLEVWDVTTVAPHLRVTFCAIDEDGRPVAWSKDLPALQVHLQEKVRAAIGEAAPVVEAAGLTTWNVGTIEPVVEAPTSSGRTVRGFPALVDEGETVALRTLASADQQRVQMWAGTRKLLRLTIASPARKVEKALGLATTLSLLHMPHASTRDLVDDCIDCAIDHLIGVHGGPVWDEAAFTKLRKAVANDLIATSLEIGGVVGEILSTVGAIRNRLQLMTNPALDVVVGDVTRQLDDLIGPDFVTATGVRRLHDIARYLRGIDIRLDKIGNNLVRDTELTAKIRALTNEHTRLMGAISDERYAEGLAIRWMLEELRVSVFAQALGTPTPISEKRVRKAIADLLG